ncbi:DUF6701 domain-containing protein [Rhizobacter sp. OV335]|uniref:DUF6701 domain-containing protein n=1 Tax=Rhizobacter sp. OV335 TaxID=1500264 RepID=UPI0009161DE2|nr:DUF6701 domain-containing protein [Rhizobacter sp. OV335]SHN12074.1 PA14 domain-containing protein [Rhizobacter sp. OV335]
MKTPLHLVVLLALGCASLPSAAGEVRGVRAEYFNMYHADTTFPTTQAVVDRIEDNINVSALSGSPAPNINATNHLVRYTGFVLVPSNGTYTFESRNDDGARLYVDCDQSGDFQSGELLVDDWGVHSSPSVSSGSCSNLVAGQRYAFRYEFLKYTGTATAMLKWRGPSPLTSTAVVIPKSDGSMGLTTNVTDSSAPAITSADVRCGATTSVEVVFSEQLDSSSAQTAGNYSLSGGYSVTAAALQPDRKTVWLTVSPAITGASVLTVSNVGDVATPMNAITGSASAGVGYSTGIASGLNATYYDQQGSTPGSYFTGTTKTTTASQINTSSTTAVPISGIPATYFSVRWRGLILFSTAGSYMLKVSFDDGGHLYLSDTLLLDSWTSGGTVSTTVTKSASTYEPITVEHYNDSSVYLQKLSWTIPGSSTEVAVPANRLFHCVMHTAARFTLSAASSNCSTCAATELTLTPVDSSGNTVNNYVGTATLSTSSGRGDWSAGASPVPSGTLDNGTANDGAATYSFAPGDLGVVKLKLGHTLAQDLAVTASDTTISGSSVTSGTLSFRDNAFSFAEDAAGKISGSDIAVAGRPHDYTVSLIKKDPSTGSCGVATDFSGSRSLKLWRSDDGGSWTAPAVVTPALSIPSSQPAASNLTLAFNAGVASFDLGTTDIGRYSLNLRDDSLSYASTTVIGSSNALTVRPFALVVGVKQGSTDNPGGSAATDTAFAKAGSSFQATVGAYRWASAMTSNGTDADSNGVPDSGATLANTTAGGLAPSFSSTVTLSPLAGSQTPSGGTLGTLGNGSVTGFSGGSATAAALKYSEVGSFAFATSGVVSNFLGSGLSLDATVFNAAGQQSTRVGRFTPASFAVSAISLTNRINVSCSVPKPFTYLGENFQLQFTLAAVNADGANTLNYTGSFAKLDPSSATAWNLGGADGSTSFLSTGSSPRLSLGTAVGSWSNGLAAAVTLSAAALRGSAPDGPFSARFGIAPVDSDGIAMGSYDLDADSSVSGNDRTLLTTVPLQYGRLKLSNAVGSQGRVLNVPLTAQTWSSGSFATNTDDQCTTVPLASVNFGNHRKTLTAADTTLSNSSLQVQNGIVFLKLAAPSAGHSGTVDIALSLDSSSATDTSCLQPWTPAAGKAATQGASLAYLRGGWCGATYDKDPAARAAFGVFHGTDRVLYQRENH